MKYLNPTLFLFATFFLIISCSEKSQPASSETKPTTSNKISIATLPDEFAWAKDHLNLYLQDQGLKFEEILPQQQWENIKRADNRSYLKISSKQDTGKHPDIFIDPLTKVIYELDTTKDSLIVWNSKHDPFSSVDQQPQNGQYRFDIAFAEWGGVSMGEKVTVVVIDGKINVIYEDDGNLSFSDGKSIMEEGQIIKHKSGDWIISNNEDDVNAAEIGGCTGGPTVVDFKEEKYWIC